MLNVFISQKEIPVAHKITEECIACGSCIPECPEGAIAEGDPVYTCAATAPAGLFQPIRGFGVVWCNLGGPNVAIGWGLEEEAGFWPGSGDPLVQDFERGIILRDSDGTTQGLAYVLFGSDGTFVRAPY